MSDQNSDNALTLEGGMWAPGPNAHWKLIGDPVGGGKGFSRAALHRNILAHHEAIHGGDSQAVSSEFENAGRGTAQTVFHKQLPGEVNRYLEGNPAARRLFRVTTDAAEAGGEDAMHDLGQDKYFAHVDRLHGATMNAALDTARSSDDPEVRFTALIHDHLPDAAGRKNLDSVPAGKLQAGQRFTYGGHPFKVVEDADGYKVLSGLGEDVPLDALKQVPVDRGSLRAPARTRSRMKADDVAPFGQTPGHALILSAPSDFKAAVTIGGDWPHPKQRNGQPCHYFWKEALPSGQPFYDGKGRRYEFDRSRLTRMVDTLKLAKSRGFEPFAPVAHSSDARNLGYVVDARLNARGSLELLHQFIGDAARDEALTKKTSICVLPKGTDEHGHEYEDLIDHNAVLPNPRLGNLDDFKPALAASRGQATHAVYLELAAPTPQEDRMIPSEFRKLVGAADDATDDQVIAAATKALGDARSEAKSAADTKVALSRANDKIQELSTTPPAKPARPSAEQLHYLGQTLALSRDAAAKAIGSEAVNAAQKRYLGSDPYDVGALTLSRDATDDDGKLADGLRRCIDFLDIAKLAKPPVRPGEKTGAQGAIALQRPDPDGAPDPTKVTADAKTEGQSWQQKQLADRGLASA